MRLHIPFVLVNFNTIRDCVVKKWKRVKVFTKVGLIFRKSSSITKYL